MQAASDATLSAAPRTDEYGVECIGGRLSCHHSGHLYAIGNNMAFRFVRSRFNERTFCECACAKNQVSVFPTVPLAPHQFFGQSLGCADGKRFTYARVSCAVVGENTLFQFRMRMVLEQNPARCVCVARCERLPRIRTVKKQI